MASAYVDPDYDIYRLRELRDPKKLGRILREDPAHFSELTPAAHLKAWLHFASEEQWHDQALAGARALDHRDSDAMEIFAGNQFDKWDLLIYLPDLDLDAIRNFARPPLGRCIGNWLRSIVPQPTTRDLTRIYSNVSARESRCAR